MSTMRRSAAMASNILRSISFCAAESTAVWLAPPAMTIDKTDPSTAHATAAGSEASFAVPADHPAMPGHFPGHPIVPGAIILDHLIAAVIAATRGEIAEIAQAKFLRPLAPGEVCRIAVDTRASPTVRVSCANDAGPVASAVLRLKAAP